MAKIKGKWLLNAVIPCSIGEQIKDDLAINVRYTQGSITYQKMGMFLGSTTGYTNYYFGDPNHSYGPYYCEDPVASDYDAVTSVLVPIGDSTKVAYRMITFENQDISDADLEKIKLIAKPLPESPNTKWYINLDNFDPNTSIHPDQTFSNLATDCVITTIWGEYTGSEKLWTIGKLFVETSALKYTYLYSGTAMGTFLFANNAHRILDLSANTSELTDSFLCFLAECGELHPHKAYIANEIDAVATFARVFGTTNANTNAYLPAIVRQIKNPPKLSITVDSYTWGIGQTTLHVFWTGYNSSTLKPQGKMSQVRTVLYTDGSQTFDLYVVPNSYLILYWSSLGRVDFSLPSQITQLFANDECAVFSVGNLNGGNTYTMSLTQK